MSNASIICDVCKRGTKVRRLTRHHGQLVAVLGMLTMAAGGFCTCAGLLAALASTGKHDGALVVITVAAPLILGGLLIMLVGALASRKKSVLWCKECAAVSDCVDISAAEIPETGPGSLLWDSPASTSEQAIQRPSAGP